jgi:hypothetical protein
MSIFGRLFPSSHVLDALTYLDGLEGKMGEQLAWASAKARARKFLMGHQKAIRSAVVLDRLAIQELVLNVITSEMVRDLASGQDHVYRGRLSMVGASKRAIYEAALAELVKAGYVSEDDANEGRAELASDLALVG